MARTAPIPPIPVAVPAEAQTDHPCEMCGNPMTIRRSGEGHWFYGCSHWPNCYFTFDADQTTGKPIFHTRHGIPFRASREDKTPALFRALRRNRFDLEAGQALSQAKGTARKKRQSAQLAHEREQVETRVQRFAPTTHEQWIDVVLAERLLAVEEDRRAEVLRARLRDKPGYARQALVGRAL